MTLAAGRNREADVRALLAREPGASVTRIAQALGIDHSTAAYHLRRLERSGLVASRQVGRDRCHFLPAIGHCEHQRAVLPLLAKPGARLALEALQAAGPVTMGRRVVDVARRTGVRVGHVRWALDLALRLGVVERSGYGRYRLAPTADACVRKALAGVACRPASDSPCAPAGAYPRRTPPPRRGA